MQVYAPSSLLKGALGVLMRGINMGDGSNLLGLIAMLINSTSDIERYPWLGEPPRLSQVDDDAEIQYSGMSDANYSITNGLWNGGILVKRKDWDDQQTNVISQRINQFAQVCLNHINRMIVNTLVAGTTGLGYDATYFFTTTHPNRGASGVQSNNLVSANYIADTVAHAKAGITLALTTLGTLIAENGEPFTEMVSRAAIVCSPTAAPIINEALYGTSVSGSGTIVPGTQGANFPGKTIGIIETPRVTGTNFYVLNISNPFDLPIILQQRDPIEMSQLLDGDDGFDRELWKFKGRWRGAGGYAHWQNAVRVAAS